MHKVVVFFDDADASPELVYTNMYGILHGPAERFRVINGRGVSATKQIVEGEQVMSTALQWSSSLAEGGPNALRQTKELLGSFSQQSSSIEETAKASAAPRLTEECRQGLEAFFAKKPVPWSSQ